LYPARVARGTARPDPSRRAVEAGGGARHQSDFEGIGGCADPVGLRRQRPAGLAGRLILDRLVNGETDTAELADLALGNLKKKKAQLRPAPAGNFTEHHRFQIRLLPKAAREYADKICRSRATHRGLRGAL